MLPEGAMDQLSLWKGRLDPYKVLLNDYDGRSVTGLDRAVKRNDEGSENKLESALLKNFFKLVQVCQKVSTADLQKTSEDDLNNWLQALRNEGQALPYTIQSQLLYRRSMQLLAEKKYPQLLTCINAFTETTTFDPFCPCLSGVESSNVEQRLSTFREMVVEKLLLSLIKKGAAGASEVCTVAKLVMGLLAQVDLVALDDAAHKEYREQRVVWRTLIALAEDSPELDYQVFARGRAKGKRPFAPKSEVWYVK
eukprot:5894053-Amphidinium_carterae.4